MLKFTRYISVVLFNQFFWLLLISATFISNKTYSAPIVISVQNCTTALWTKRKLVKLKQNNFALNSSTVRQKLALQLVNCLGESDAVLRDGIAFEGLSYWMRAKALDEKTRVTIFKQLIGLVNSKEDPSDGFYPAFSALMLAEVIRADRVKPFLSIQQRQQTVDTMAKFMIKQQDHRGFDDIEGWRHAIAHTADVFLQLALNPATTKAQADIMLNAISYQIVPKDGHFYIYGEPRRLAFAVVYIYLRDFHSDDEWQAWVTNISQAKPFNNWQETYQSQRGLAKLHNTQLFLQSFYVLIRESTNPRLKRMQPALIAALKSVG
jgi:uncharacterized protein DUF2785